MRPRINVFLPALMFAATVVFGAAIGNPDAASVTRYKQVNLAANTAGAPHRDKKLVNPWGIASLGGGKPFWINDERTGFSELIDGTGRVLKALPNVVVPLPKGGTSHPTGIVANTTSDFMMSGGPAQFIFATFDGTIAAWNPGTTATIETAATTEVDNSTKAAYTGLAMATVSGHSFLYAANSLGTIDKFDGTFAPVVPKGGFTDPSLPAGLTPYGIANIGSNLFVTFSQGFMGTGVVDEFDTDGNLLRRIATGGPGGAPLNGPWAVVTAPAHFGIYSNDLLVGNFGDGTIDVFDPTTAPPNPLKFLGQLKNASGRTLRIPGLWGLMVGGDTAKVPNPNALYFTAGPRSQQNGLFGYLLDTPARRRPPPPPTHCGPYGCY